ncbi:sulfite exporter TauE/SafE family protein [Thiomicrorhabdus indica]|uniref:sulfite exporter TauE/SafE family protein n=1 Tax=Thiomicrorhabdus indica TaxID=2267253 RepID=UPI00102D9D34|nr:sulfite exporter TauE/SafE family protein [Thiomicrorhabdus indica]
MEWTLLVTAAMVGLLGGVHCLGMCGGVVGTLTFSLDVRNQQSWWRMLPFQFAYNMGRILSYMVIGAIFGLIGMAMGSLSAMLPVQQALQIFAGIFMIALGLYLGGWWFGVAKIEKVGQGLWHRLQPYAQRMTPVSSPLQAFSYGLVWGWLPCGLVYSTLIMAMTAGGALEGALVMMAFGLGTLPNLMLMGVFAFYFTRLARTTWVKTLAGLGVIGMGVYQIYLASVVSVG